VTLEAETERVPAKRRFRFALQGGDKLGVRRVAGSSLLARSLLQPPRSPRPLQHRLIDPQRSRIHQLPALAAGPGPLRHGLVVQVDHLLRLLDLPGRGREDVVGERDLVGADAPLADGAERGGVGGLLDVGVIVLEVAEGAVDGVDAGGAAGGDHADAVGGPHVAGVALVLVEFVAEAHAPAAGEVAEAEDERLEAGRGGADLDRWCPPGLWACWPARKRSGGGCLRRRVPDEPVLASSRDLAAGDATSRVLLHLRMPSPPQ